MSVDLSQYLDQEVRVTYENGDKIIGRVKKYYPVNEYSQLKYSVRDEDNLDSTYTRDGFYWNSKGPHSLNIVKIEPITMKKYEQLEEQVRKLQEEVKNLVAKIDHLKKEEEKRDKLPKGFSREDAIEFLGKFDRASLCRAFIWFYTPQGEDYWDNISSHLQKNNLYKVPQEAVMAIQSWVIESYKEKYRV